MGVLIYIYNILSITRKYFSLSNLHFPLCFSVADDIARLLSTDRTLVRLLEAARDLERSAQRRKLLGDMLLVLEDHSEMESRADDQEWFQG